MSGIWKVIFLLSTSNCYEAFMASGKDVNLIVTKLNKLYIHFAIHLLFFEVHTCLLQSSIHG